MAYDTLLMEKVSWSEIVTKKKSCGFLQYATQALVRISEMCDFGVKAFYILHLMYASIISVIFAKVKTS